MNLTMTRVKKNNRRAGKYWFSPATMRFFRSKIESKLLKEKYFITSEQFEDDWPRLFTVRIYNPITHRIDTVGDFQQYKTKEAVLVAIGKLE